MFLSAVCPGNSHGASSEAQERLGGNAEQLKEQGTAAGSCRAAGMVSFITAYLCQIHGDSRRVKGWDGTSEDDDTTPGSLIISRTWKKIGVEVLVFTWENFWTFFFFFKASMWLTECQAGPQ